MSEYGQAELERRLHNLIRIGRVAQIDHAHARVRVRCDALLTQWLPWQAGRAGTTRVWNPPSVGEHVLLLSPGGNTLAAVALSALFSTGSPALRQSGDLWAIEMPDGAVIEYDHAASHLQATLPGTAVLDARGDVTVTTPAALTATAAAGATINANVTINGNLTLNGNLSQPSGKTASIAGDVALTGAVTSNGKDISADHRHSGVESGRDDTGSVI